MSHRCADHFQQADQTHILSRYKDVAGDVLEAQDTSTFPLAIRIFKFSFL